MRLVSFLVALTLICCLGIDSVQAQLTEQEIVNSYLQKTVAKHTRKLGWASVNFTADRINRHNDYNDFTIFESQKLASGEFDWIRQGYTIGADFGFMVRKKIGWSIGGEYWLKMGQTLAEGDSYLQLSTGTQVSADPKSEIQVYGITTSLHYFLVNPPSPTQQLSGLSIRANGSVGYYAASWDLWAEYENLNLSTAEPAQANTTFKGSAPGFSIGLGMDYPLNLWGLGLGFDMNYLHLNFTNVAWYNTAGEEIVASLDGTQDTRVDLSFSGVRGKIELKRYFSW
jgi:hypothetical protein